MNNTITPDLQSESITSADASYILRAPKFKARLTGFYSKIQNATEISFFYGEGIGGGEIEVAGVRWIPRTVFWPKEIGNTHCVAVRI